MKHLAIVVLISVVFASTVAVAEPKKDRDKGAAARVQAVKQAPQARPAQAPRQIQSQPAQVRPMHQSGGAPVRLPQPQYRDDRRDHGHGGGFLGDVGRFLRDAARTPVYYPPTYGGYVPVQPLGYGYASTIPSIVEDLPNGRCTVTIAYPPGTVLRALGEYVTDPNSGQVLGRREIATLVATQYLNDWGLRICDIVRGNAGRGDDIMVAPPAPMPAGY